ncbi:MAG: RNA-binding transcriptional accessory protein [Candidatus Obscuribacterales bacterium]|nr:RNA-binding transcriptional accessory protein [Candidatus Obscuribacterales bacterium]
MSTQLKSSDSHAARIAAETQILQRQVSAVLDLLAEGATVPFIARYRKEASGSLDEVQIMTIRDRAQQLEELDKRREAILKSLSERNLLSPELQVKVDAAVTLTELEDLYLPFKPKRKTRAGTAREKGLEALAREIFEYKLPDPQSRARDFICEEKGVKSAQEAIEGARDIIAEWISEDENMRKEMRSFWRQNAQLYSKVVKNKETEGAKFKDYFDWTEPCKTIPSHRILAVFRGEEEGFLRVSIYPEENKALDLMDRRFFRNNKSECSKIMELAIEESYDRLLEASMETELKGELKLRADQEAIRVFVSNLRELLMAAPLGEKSVLAVDPGFRTGCKIVCLSRQGALLEHDVIYPHEESARGKEKRAEAEKKILALCKKFQIEAFACGNGTAGRETEAFLKGIDFTSLGVEKLPVIMVNESGASIYSASEVAREEFPDQDITVRGAVSIGRRLMDPLAELVKLDPKSIGVGQYQHDVDQKALQSSLDDTVMSCVNSVGVELNTASKELLSYVSGLNKQIAGNIVKHRQENGPFSSRLELKKVTRLGPKAFEQCAGFLRIRGSKNPLDASAVHPERYELLQAMSKDLNCNLSELMANADLRKKIDIRKYVSDSVGLPTLEDILLELEKPGRDPRAKLEQFQFADGVNSIDDLREGMQIPGIVTNVTAFGAFVDIGVHQDGLVHVSELADRFIKDPNEVVKVQQKVKVTVMQVDKARKRISLSMKR